MLLDQPIDLHFELFNCIDSHDFGFFQTSCLSLVLRLTLVKFLVGLTIPLKLRGLLVDA
jgi:hypothetical protein